MKLKKFKITSNRYNKEQIVEAKDKQNALDKVAVLDNNFYFTGILGKDVFVEEVKNNCHYLMEDAMTQLNAI